MICKICGFNNGSLNLIEEYDSIDSGFWCYGCNGYNYFNEQDDTRIFKLILEDKGKKDDTRIEKSKIKFNKRLSPLRYPGGKSKLIEFLYMKMQGLEVNTFVEVFSGGASVGLALLEAKIINKLVINDKDYGIYSLFKTIIENPQHLINKIMHTNLSHDDFFNAQDIIKNNYTNTTLEESAWSFLVANRLAYSGICKANPLGGKKGSLDALLSRWNKDSLISRIKKIHALKDKIVVLNLDANDVIEEYYWDDSNFLFIDPPYLNKGPSLYNLYYTTDDHVKLSVLLTELYHEFPCANILITYDNDNFIENLYWNANVDKINRVYSI